jgi:hypothetical protein
MRAMPQAEMRVLTCMSFTASAAGPYVSSARTVSLVSEHTSSPPRNTSPPQMALCEEDTTGQTS